MGEPESGPDKRKETPRRGKKVPEEYRSGEEKREELEMVEKMDRYREGSKHISLSDRLEYKEGGLSLSFLEKSDVLAILHKSQEEAGEPSDEPTLRDIREHLVKTAIPNGVEYSYNGHKVIEIFHTGCGSEIAMNFYSEVDGEERVIGRASYSARRQHGRRDDDVYLKYKQLSRSVDLDGTTYVYIERQGDDRDLGFESNSMNISGYSVPPGVPDEPEFVRNAVYQRVERSTDRIIDMDEDEHGPEY